MSSILLLASVFAPILLGLGVFVFKKKLTYKGLCLYTLIAMLVSTVLTLVTVFTATGSVCLFKMTENIGMTLRADSLSKLFGILMSLMMTTVGIYAFGYMEHENDRHRFFAFYLMVFGVLNGIYMASNPLTLYLFYELMTLLSLPLVFHEMTKEAIAAGFKYLFYSVGGAFLSLLAIFMIYKYAASYEFKLGGILTNLSGSEMGTVLPFTLLVVIGFGCKAGLFPLHDWLPTAHPVAPAPASAILSGIITKSGVIAIIRMIYYTVGADIVRGTWVQYTWMILALITVFMGSMMAFREKLLKKRLAYSTVSQVSYVLFGLSLLNSVGFKGALLHVVFHSVIKDGLFLEAGAIIHETGIVRTDELKGIGLRMPKTLASFALASLALVGIPPACGFVSKWFLCSGALEAYSTVGALSYIGPAILLVSALLTAGYLFPVVIDGFLPGKDFDRTTLTKCDPCLKMIVPIIVLGILAILLGIIPGPITSLIEEIM